MFIILPVGVNYATQRLPIITLVLMGINVAVYLITLFCGGFTDKETEQWVYDNLWLTPNISHVHTYLTSMFVHEGFFHLLGNMIYLFLFGCCVEDVMGRWKYLAFYISAGIVAGLAEIISSPMHFASEIPMGGASGAVTGCIAGFLVLFTKREIEFKYFGLIVFRPVAGEFSLAAWIVITFWFIKDLFFAFLSRALNPNQDVGGVAFAAHIGGFLWGLAMVGLFRMLNKPVVEDESSVAQWNPSMIRRAALERTRAEAAAVESPTIFLSEGGNQSGPFTSQQVREMISIESISTDALYWQEGMEEWSPVQDFAV